MRFIHLADVHLGAKPDQRYPWSLGRGEEIWDTFRQVIEEAGQQKIDLLLIAGDLFHGQPLLRELREVNYLFSMIPDTAVVLIAGNHDYLGRDSFYQAFTWNSNVFFMREPTLQRVALPGLHTYVYGLSYHSRQITENLYRDACPGGEEGFHILLAHGGDGQHIPIDVGLLGQVGFSYVALGHIHQPQMIQRNGMVNMAYAGSLEPVEKHEEGPHGYIRGEYKGGRLSVELVRKAKRSYETLHFPVERGMSQYETERLLGEALEKRGTGNMYRILLEGERDSEQSLNLERLYGLGRVVDVQDHTRLAYDYQALERKFAGTLIGEYIRAYQGRELDEIEKKALDYGLQALLETRE